MHAGNSDDLLWLNIILQELYKTCDKTTASIQTRITFVYCYKIPFSSKTKQNCEGYRKKTCKQLNTIPKLTALHHYTLLQPNSYTVKNVNPWRTTDYRLGNRLQYQFPAVTIINWNKIMYVVPPSNPYLKLPDGYDKHTTTSHLQNTCVNSSGFQEHCGNTRWHSTSFVYDQTTLSTHFKYSKYKSFIVT